MMASLSDPPSEAKIISLEERAAAQRRKISAATLAQLIVSDKGVTKACEHNARVLIAAAPQWGKLHFDDFLSRMRDGERDWTDADDVEMLCYLQATHLVASFTIGQIRNACRAVAYSRRRDSLREFVEGLPEWDGTPRIELAFVEAWGAREDALARAASRNLFIALIARALAPGCQVDTLWTIEGPQGTYKSQSLRALGEHFHAEVTAPIGTADFLREMRGLWLAELSELDSLRGREASTVKRILSSPSDRFVEKYQTHAQRYERRAVAVATTNEAAYWQDSTGARRLIPITAGAIRVDLIRANRLQWFAEALHRYRAGETWWQFPDGIADAQDARQSVDPWEDTLSGMIAHGRPAGDASLGRFPWPAGWIASAEIMRDWLRLEPHQQGHAVSKRLGHVMRRLGYKPKRSASGSERGWEPDASQSRDSDVSDVVSEDFSL